MFLNLEVALQKDLIEFCRAEEANKEPKPLKEILVAEVLRQIIKGEREITGLLNKPSTGDIFVRFSFTKEE